MMRCAPYPMRFKLNLTAAVRLMAGAASALAIAALPAFAVDESPFRVYPEQVTLEHAEDLQRVVAVMYRDDGVTIDVTQDAAITFEPEGLATWDGERFVVRPGTDGEGTVTIKHGEHEAQLPVVIKNAANARPISFRNDIEPILLRAGCNTGACHGSASGKNGFHLTLFGYDPDEDYINLTRQVRGRRLDAASPEESLILQKATGQVAHEGGERIETGSEFYEVIARWVEEGAKNDAGEVPGLTEIRILPEAAVLEGAGAQQRFVVMAEYSDGTNRDVTELAVLSSGDDMCVTVDERGVATAADRGEAYIMARFGTFAVVSKTITIPEGETLEWPEDVTAKNYVDEYVFDKLKKLRVAPATVCSDEIFVRRVYLDILGVLPTVEETRSFLADEAPDKRAVLIDKLLERPEFAELWTMKWAEALQVRSDNSVDPKAMYSYNDWIREAMVNNKPVDALVQDLLSAEGGNFTSPATNFYLLEAQPEMIAENVAQVFLGIQLQCAQCHNHPFERWTMDDYYSFAAFFAQVGRKNSADPRETIVFNRGGGEVKHIFNGQNMAPKFLGGETPDVAGKDRRAVLAEWMTAEDNPWFAKNTANRVWAHFFGRGIVDPIDDVRVTNPASNPELLAKLGEELKAADYDLKALVRSICNSYTYQMSTQPRNPEVRDERNFAVAAVRRLPAELLLDALCSVTETDVKFKALPQGARAVEAPDGDSGNYFLEVFGRPARESACTCERSNEPTLAQVLHLINGTTIDTAIKAGDSRLQQQLTAGATPEQVIEDLYVAAYSRKPSEAELTKLTEYVAASEDPKPALEDVYWSVLNSKEFVFNH
jgi:hypothetical protein